MAAAHDFDAALPAGLEHATCPLCGADEAEATRYGEGPHRVMRCWGCTLWYISPRLTPEATNALYEDDGYFAGGEAGYGDYRAQERSLRATFRRLLGNMAKRGATGGALLDVGAGLGFMLDEARPFFERREGVELSPAAATEAARAAEASVHLSLDALPADAAFDTVTALHVIEHIPDALGFAERLMGLVRPGGTLVLAAPDMGAFWRPVLGKAWPSWKIPEHVAFYDARTLRDLMERAGGEGLRRLPYLHDFPLDEVIGKAGIRAPKRAARYTMPLPRTTICYMARRPDGR